MPDDHGSNPCGAGKPACAPDSGALPPDAPTENAPPARKPVPDQAASPVSHSASVPQQETAQPPPKRDRPPRRRSTLERAAQAEQRPEEAPAVAEPAAKVAEPAEKVAEPAKKAAEAPPATDVPPSSDPIPLHRPMPVAEAATAASSPARAPAPASEDAASETEDSGRDAFALMRRFVGEKTAERYDALYREYEEDGHLIGWSWPAFLLGPVWLFYRKLEVEGAIYLIVPAVLLLVSGWTLPFIFIGYGLLWIFAKQYYLYRAERRIYRIEQQPLPAAERDVLLTARGGTSVRAALAAGLLGIGLIAGFYAGPTWNNAGAIMASLRASVPTLPGTGAGTAGKVLPGCDSKAVQTTVHKLVLQQLSSLGMPTDGVRTGNFSQLSATEDERDCKMTLVMGGQASDYRAKVLWRDVNRSTYIVQLAPL